jgi:hypothetical protein
MSIRTMMVELNGIEVPARIQMLQSRRTRPTFTAGGT